MKQFTLILLMVSLSSLYSKAKIISVPANYTTIQEGINSASNGDTVLVAPGTYLENINFAGKNITVSSNLYEDWIG